LKAIAAATGGFYVSLGTQGEGLEAIFSAVLGTMAKHDLASRRQKIYIERYQWPLAGSLAMLLASLVIGTRRRHGAQAAAASSAVAAAGLMLMMTARVLPAQAADDAPVLDSKRPVLDYNAGTAAYRAGQFPQAAQSFQQSISHAPSSDLKRLGVQEDAYYNLGNALYRAGQKTEQSSPQETLQKWNDAVKAYETALQLRADDADSKFNRDLVKRKIDALNQQQSQNKQNNKDQGQNKNQPPDSGQKPNQPQDKGSGQTPQQPPGQSPQQPPGQSPQQPPGQPPPQNGDQPPRSAGQPPPAPNAGEGQGGDGGDQAADNQRVPGQMTREEARELLDSVKGDERHSLGVPVAQRDAALPPDKPFKNW
jgi:Ca-activated chloride channel family protein